MYLLTVDLHILRATEHLEPYGIREIRDISRKNDLAISKFPFLRVHDLSVNDYLTDTVIDTGYLKELSFHIPSDEHIGII